jgi:hypothetical protein
LFAAATKNCAIIVVMDSLSMMFQFFLFPFLYFEGIRLALARGCGSEVCCHLRTFSCNTSYVTKSACLFYILMLFHVLLVLPTTRFFLFYFEYTFDISCINYFNILYNTTRRKTVGKATELKYTQQLLDNIKRWNKHGESGRQIALSLQTAESSLRKRLEAVSYYGYFEMN